MPAAVRVSSSSPTSSTDATRCLRTVPSAATEPDDPRSLCQARAQHDELVLALVASRTVGYERLKSLRRYVIVLNLIVAALLTTPEVLTQALAATALQAIYEVTVLIARYGERHEKNRGATSV